MFMCVQLKTLFDSKNKVYNVIQVVKQGINVNTICSHYILEFRNKQSHLVQVYLGASVKIEMVIENHVC